MKLKFILYISILGMLVSCVEEPTFSSSPVLFYEGVEYRIDGDNRTFNISFGFQDQEGDLFTTAPTDLLVFSRVNTNTVKVFFLNDADNVDTLYVRFIPAELDGFVGDTLFDFDNGLPDPEKFDDCENLFGTFPITFEGQTQEEDFLVLKDTSAKNLKVRFYKKQNGKEVLLDRFVGNITCSTEDIYDTKFKTITDPSFTNAKEGTITYIIKDNDLGLARILRSDSFKLKLWLSDEENHRSNVIESPDMILPQNVLDLLSSEN